MIIVKIFFGLYTNRTVLIDLGQLKKEKFIPREDHKQMPTDIEKLEEGWNVDIIWFGANS